MREREGGVSCDDIVVIVTVDMMMKWWMHAADCKIKETEKYVDI